VDRESLGRAEPSEYYITPAWVKKEGPLSQKNERNSKGISMVAGENPMPTTKIKGLKSGNARG